MKILHFSDAPVINIDEDTAVDATKRVIIKNSDSADPFSIRIFEIKKGGTTPWYFFEWDHEIFIHSGIGEILLNNEWIPVTEGYVIYVDKFEEHQVKNRGNAPLIIVSRIPSDTDE